MQTNFRIFLHFSCAQISLGFQLCWSELLYYILYTYSVLPLYYNSNGKTTKIRRKAIREPNVSRSNMGPSRSPLKPIGPSQHYRIEGYKGPRNWAPFCRKTPASRTADVSFSSLNKSALFELRVVREGIYVLHALYNNNSCIYIYRVVQKKNVLSYFLI